MFPSYHTGVSQTPKGTPYLRESGVVMIAATRIDLSGIQRFLDGFHSSLGYSEYLEDPVLLSDAEQLCKFAGQVCYMSFGPKRTMNEDAFRYLQNIKESKHGSIFEHV